MEPLEEFVAPRAAFGSALGVGHAESMPAGTILDVAVRDMIICERLVEDDGVAIVDNGVVEAVDEKDGWILGGDTVLDGKALTDDSFVFSIFPEKGAA